MPKERILNQNTRKIAEIKHMRTRLETVIPLPAPYTVYIDPCGACNFKCNFWPCNNSSFQAKERHQLMAMDIFQRIYDGLEEWRDAGTPVKVVNLYAFGEPLLNGNLVEMLKRIKSGNVCREVRLTTNASLLTSELGHRLIDAGLDHLRVSVEALDSDGYKEICGANVSFEDIVEKISNYYDYSRNKGCYVDVKIVDAAFHTSEDENKFYDVFESISDTHFVERVEAIWPGFENVIIPENSVAEVKSTCRKYIDASERGICTFPFTDMIIHANGNVSPCCSDWSGALFYGNVAEQTLREIWNGENHRKLQIQHLNKQAYSTTICKECDRIPMDDITPYAAKLLEKFETHD